MRFLYVKWINLLCLVMRIFIFLSFELVVERLFFEMVLIVLFIVFSRELLNLYCIFFVLKLKEFEVLDLVFSFFSWDWVIIFFLFRLCLNVVNFWLNFKFKSCENNFEVLVLNNVEFVDYELVVWVRFFLLKDLEFEVGMFVCFVFDGIIDVVKLEEMLLGGFCII